jgi:hypothetical protein
LPSAGQAAVLDSAVANPVALPLAATLTSYRPSPGGTLARSSNEAGLRVQLVSDALAAATFKSPDKIAYSTDKPSDCECHKQGAKSEMPPRFRPTVSDGLTAWDLIGAIPNGVLSG